MEKEEKQIKKENKSVHNTSKESEKPSGNGSNKPPELILNKQQGDFSINYFTNLDTQIESVKHNTIDENNFKIQSKKNSNDRDNNLMQISIESYFIFIFFFLISFFK